MTAGPVMLTLQSKPVLGNVCQSPSAAMSGNVSVAVASVQTCSGYPISYWRAAGEQGVSAWPGLKPSMPFHPTFRAGRVGESRQYVAAGLQSRSYTMLELLDGTSPNCPTGICSHFIVAQLNIQRGLIPKAVMDLRRLYQVWAEWSWSGVYKPSAVANPWDAAAIVQYFKASGIAPS